MPKITGTGKSRNIDILSLGYFYSWTPSTQLHKTGEMGEAEFHAYHFISS